VAEGDTIRIAATLLQAAFRDDPLTRFEAPRLPPPHPEPGCGMSITSIGKHLLVGFDGGLTLHTHLGMDGWWRLERSPERPLARRGRPGTGSQVRLATATASAVVGDAPVVELLDPPGLRRHPVLRALGPDLCDEDPDLDETLRRLERIDRTTPIGVVLLDQRPACGIGNVFRSEVLWAERVAPRTPLDRLGPDDRRRLYGAAHRSLRANLERQPRRTTPTGLAVYRRAGRACLRCTTVIRSERLGEHARIVWWCPSCQPER
jgi:endonuclease VIII